MKINNCEAVQKNVAQQLQTSHKVNPPKTHSKKPLRCQMRVWAKGMLICKAQVCVCPEEQQTYFIMIKATDFIHVQPLALLCIEGGRRKMNQEHLMASGDEPREGEYMHTVNSTYLATKLLTLQTASKF